MMRSDWLADWSDNPIFIKHLRSRLRRQPLVSAIVVTVVLCICIAWGGFVLKSFTTGGAFGALFALQAVILAIMGSTQVGTSVSSARTSGILDFHRVSPLSATELVLGFFFGAPVREYLLVACTLPFVLLCLAFGTPDFRGLVQLMIVLIATSWVLQGFSLLNALVMKRQTGSRGVVGLLIFLGLFSGTFITGFGRVANLVEQEPRLSLFGISLPWLAVVLLYEAATLFFIFLASCRKMESERLHPFSKPQAVAAMTTLAVLIVGAVWDLSDFEAMAVTVLYLLVIIGILLTITVTPTQAEYYKGLWRAVKQGRPRPSFWDDLSPNRPFLAVVCALVLIAGTIAWRRLGGPMASGIERRAIGFSVIDRQRCSGGRLFRPGPPVLPVAVRTEGLECPGSLLVPDLGRSSGCGNHHAVCQLLGSRTRADCLRAQPRGRSRALDGRR